MLDDSRPLRTSVSAPIEDDSAQLDWTVALAGGDGARLAEYVTRRFGRRIPKQYCNLLGTRSMVEHTLERLNRITPPSRTLSVIGTAHGDYAYQLAGKSDHVVRQPSRRDTGLALYMALAMIKRWTPNALVTVTPTDHYVAPSAKYIEQVRAARGVAARMRDKVVILGVRPTEPDPELGYLTLGAHLTEIPQVRQIERFVEKPSVTTALDMMSRGALWNTMVTCGTVEALWDSADPASRSCSTASTRSCPDRDSERTMRSTTSTVRTCRSASRGTSSSAPRRGCARWSSRMSSGATGASPSGSRPCSRSAVRVRCCRRARSHRDSSGAWNLT